MDQPAIIIPGTIRKFPMKVSIKKFCLVMLGSVGGVILYWFIWWQEQNVPAACIIGKQCLISIDNHDLRSPTYINLRDHNLTKALRHANVIWQAAPLHHQFSLYKHAAFKLILNFTRRFIFFKTVQFTRDSQPYKLITVDGIKLRKSKIDRTLSAYQSLFDLPFS